MTNFEPGLSINRNVRLLHPLGEGGMGAVWVAEHLTLQTNVAVKFIKRNPHSDPELTKRFELEAQAVAKIKSPHVVQIFDHGAMADGTSYIIMELMEGESLCERLDRTGWLSFGQCAQVVTQVAKALRRAHAAGIIHRDIKPDNIFLCPADDGLFVKLLDFGVAKVNHDPRGLTSPGVLVGTTEYMSREQVISAREVDFRCDLWALGVVAYEALTGDIPFAGETMGSVCVAICNGEYTPPSQLRKGVNPEVDRWFAKVFSRNAAERFQSASEQASAFRAALLAGDGWNELDELSGEHPVPLTKETTKVGLGPAEQEAVMRASFGPIDTARHRDDESGSFARVFGTPSPKPGSLRRNNAPTEVDQQSQPPRDSTPGPEGQSLLDARRPSDPSRISDVDVLRETQPSSMAAPPGSMRWHYVGPAILLFAAALIIGFALRPSSHEPRVSQALRAAAPSLQLTARSSSEPVRPIVTVDEEDGRSDARRAQNDVPATSSVASPASDLVTEPSGEKATKETGKTIRPRADYGF